MSPMTCSYMFWLYSVKGCDEMIKKTLKDMPITLSLTSDTYKRRNYINVSGSVPALIVLSIFNIDLCNFYSNLL